MTFWCHNLKPEIKNFRSKRRRGAYRSWVANLVSSHDWAKVSLQVHNINITFVPWLRFIAYLPRQSCAILMYKLCCIVVDAYNITINVMILPEAGLSCSPTYVTLFGRESKYYRMYPHLPLSRKDSIDSG